MHLLVTGAAGFIGSHFVDHVIRETDYRVTSLDVAAPTTAATTLEPFEHPRHGYVQGEIGERDAITRPMESADSVVHFAAETHVDRSIDDARGFADANVTGTATLLDVAAETDVDRFVQISTDEVYGEVHHGAATEGTPLEPRNPYAATKVGAEKLALSFHATHGLPVVVTRATNTYGPRQRPEKLIPKTITRAKNGEPIPLYGDGSNVREWLYVEDHCTAVRRVLEDGRPGAIYNVGSGVRLTNLDVVGRIVDLVGASPDLIEFVEDRPGHDQRYAVDCEKLERLGWTPHWSFAEGLRQTVSSVLEASESATEPPER